ncbi:hypothetical protein N7450_001836 [Penicillium hetheringtonii]|uniref:Uncharacterized protein n=1 Tax=Penicillium hetheringtonii TaxID=911720 RepID=A0AAD6E4Y8_9EURO|nr:hypothetical protein N7450_001836 [Penicillium hetheringtonii]
MDTPIRRVIAEHDTKGNASFVSDEWLTPYDPTTAPEFTTPGPSAGFGVVQIHRSRGFPADNMRPLPDPHKTLVPLADTKGPSCRILDLPPAESGWMHRTLSLDYFVVIWDCGNDYGRQEIITEDGVRLEKTPAGPIYDPEEE